MIIGPKSCNHDLNRVDGGEGKIEKLRNLSLYEIMSTPTIHQYRDLAMGEGPINVKCGRSWHARHCMKA